MAKKRGSKVIETCPVCGKSMTKAGLIGHLRFKHGRDHKAPMIPIMSPELAIVRARAVLKDAGLHIHANVREQIACLNCRQAIGAELMACEGCRAELVAAFQKAGYTIKAPEGKPSPTERQPCTVRLPCSHVVSKGIATRQPCKVRLPCSTIVKAKA